MPDTDSMGSMAEAMATTMGEAFDAAQVGPDDVPAAAPEATPSPARDESGRFVGSDDTEIPAADLAGEKPGEPEAETPAAQTPETGEGEALDAPIIPPGSWTAEEREVFTALPPDVQAIISQREGERDAGLTQKATELADQRKQYDDIEAAIAPRREQFRLEGLTDAQAITQILALEKSARAEPAQFIQWFADQRGINLKALVNTGAADTDGDYADPAVEAINRVEREQNARWQNFQAEQNAAREAHAQQQIQAFKSETGTDGTLLRPHFDQVETVMTGLIAAKLATDLSTAYEKACRLDPAIQQQAETTRTETENGKRVADAKAAVARAKRAKDELTTARSGRSTVAAKNETVEETAGRVWDEMNG